METYVDIEKVGKSKTKNLFFILSPSFWKGFRTMDLSSMNDRWAK